MALDVKKLQRVIIDALEDVKAQDILVFDTEHLSALFERVVVASGTSNRQTRSLAASVRDAVKGAGGPQPRTEGEENGEWIIVDCGPAVVHVMQPAIRAYYHLEELWGEKPIKSKAALRTAVARLGGEPVRRLAAPSEPMGKTAARKAPASASPAAGGKGRKSAIGSVPSAKSPARSGTGTAAKKSARKAAAPKATGTDARPGTASSLRGASRAASPAPRKSAAPRAGAPAPRAASASRSAAPRPAPLPRSGPTSGSASASKTAARTAAKTAAKTARKTPAKTAPRKRTAPTSRDR